MSYDSQCNQSDITVIGSNVPSGLQLRVFQYGGVKFLVERKRALLASDPGLGKTVMLITALNVIRFDISKVLVLCPKSMILTWKRELAKWKLWDDGDVDVTVINYDKLVLAKHKNKLLSQKYDVVICDESHQAIKNPETMKDDEGRKILKCRRARVIMEELLPTNPKYVWLSTATPASTSAINYFNTLKVLLPDLMQRWSIWDFKREFCEWIPDRFAQSGFRYEGFRNTHILRDIFKACALRHRKEEVAPDLPPVVNTDVEVELDKNVVSDYLDLDKELLCKMFENGHSIPDHISKVLQACALGKIASLVELVTGLPENVQFVVFAWHRVVVERLYDVLTEVGINVRVINGETSEAQRNLNVDNFQNGKLQCLVLNMLSGGVGITLTAASIGYYIEHPQSPEHYIQSMNRIHRIGSTHSTIQIVRIVGEGTYDTDIFEVLDKRLTAIAKVGV